MKFFITGIGTDVGKTIAAAILTQALEADYWKPIQAGDLENSDTQKVKKLVANSKTVFHPESYRLQTPASPHFSAEIDSISIEKSKIIEPITPNHLVIEGAGGVFVPINQTETIMDIIPKECQVIVVSRHYLGSINHTLLTIEALRNRNLTIAGIIFNGDEIPSTESIILQKTKCNFLGRIANEPYFDTNVIADYATVFREKLIHI